MNSENFKEYNYLQKEEAGILICAGGFEDRSLTFSNSLRKKNIDVEHAIVIRYESQKQDNESNFNKLNRRLQLLLNKDPAIASVHAEKPIHSCGTIKEQIRSISSQTTKRTAIIDISGMTHLWALATIHACISQGFKVKVIYVEAKSYFPQKTEMRSLIRAWESKDYILCGEYLQSSGLKHIHLLPEFTGNFRPNKQTCLMIFAGYEPNRIVSLVDDYAPGRLIVLYGKSPRPELSWRTDLSKKLHRELFSKWFVRETEISTLEVESALLKLEEEFLLIQEEYDIAIAPQCSKMQALASYLFWRRHPEIQLVFTTPVRFNPLRYSKGSRLTYIFEVS